MNFKVTYSLLTTFFFIGCLGPVKVLNEQKNDRGELEFRKIYDREMEYFIEEEYMDGYLYSQKTINEKDKLIKKKKFYSNGNLSMEVLYEDSVFIYQKMYKMNGVIVMENRLFHNFNKGIMILYDSIGRPEILRIREKKQNEIKVKFDTLNNPIQVIFSNDSIVLLR